MEEFSGAALGDARLTKRLIRLVDDLSAQPTQSIPVACGGWVETKAAYRLLDHDALDWRAVLSAHGEPTVARMGQESRVLCEAGYHGVGFHQSAGHRWTRALELRRATWNVLASDRGGERERGGFGRAGRLDGQSRKPQGEIDIPESRPWTEGYERIAELSVRLPDTRLVYVADRESDLRELLDRAAELGHPADYVIRAKHDRVLAEGGKLRAEVERQAILGEVQFTLPAASGRSARTVTQSVRVARLNFGPPRRTAPRDYGDPVLRGSSAGGREAGRMAASQQRSCHHSGRCSATYWLVSAALADRNLLPHSEERLQGGSLSNWLRWNGWNEPW